MPIELALILCAGTLVVGYLLSCGITSRRTGQTMLDVLRGKPGEERAA